MADRIKRRYIKAGYILTDVYFPEQSIDAEGGTVEFVVVEARIGQVRVTNHDPKAGISKETAESVLRAYLPAGTLISQYRLDRPILLLRDLSGVDAVTMDVFLDDVARAQLPAQPFPEGHGVLDGGQFHGARLGLSNVAQTFTHAGSAPSTDGSAQRVSTVSPARPAEPARR